MSTLCNKKKKWNSKFKSGKTKQKHYLKAYLRYSGLKATRLGRRLCVKMYERTVTLMVSSARR